MPRIKPQYRNRLMQDLYRKIKRCKQICPNYIRGVDRLMYLDCLAKDIDWTSPNTRPDKETKIVAGDIPAEDLEKIEQQRILAEFNAKHYGRGNGRATKSGDSAATTTSDAADPKPDTQ